MYLIFTIFASCLAVLPPADTNSRRTETHIHMEVYVDPLDQNQFFVNMEGCNPEQWVELRIINVIDRQVFAQSYSPTEAQNIHLDFSMLPHGMYLIEVKQGECERVRRILYQ